MIAHNGYKAAYERLQKSANNYSSVTPMYTLFGTLIYEYLQGEERYLLEKEKVIKDWLSYNLHEEIPVLQGRYPENLIIILAESFESWVLETFVEEKEITPALNRLLKEEQTLYAPYVLSQVKGGRSIDGQLLINTGLLPIAAGSYSTRFLDNYYPSLAKAFKGKMKRGKPIALP
ncbi:MAG: hypothetical protein LUD02_02940 [Tannerellaceae bacterium]|nr:hypothetical protein [Tannerellaceae bacterium]MCD8263227.1 hypothetical protein [Tannerellaceae bacterium]